MQYARLAHALVLAAFSLFACAPDTSASAPDADAPDAAGYAFHVQVIGNGSPMILIPGLACDGRVWDATVEHYKARHQLFVLTLAGFGGARAPVAAPFLATVRSDLARYIRAQNLDHPIIVGHSVGGFLAFWIASAEPDLLAGIVSVDGVPYLPALRDPAATPATIAEAAQMAHDQIAALTPEMWAASSQQSLATMITDPAEVARVQMGAGKSSPLAVANAYAEMLVTDLRPEVAKITVPTLLLQAGPDGAEAYDAQVASIADHRVVPFPASRHFIMLDAPADFWTAVDELLVKANR